jgi:hypothetical protein
LDEAPLYRHDCVDCTHLGRIEASVKQSPFTLHSLDLYACGGRDYPNLVARFDDDATDRQVTLQSSSVTGTTFYPWFDEADRRRQVMEREAKDRCWEFLFLEDCAVSTQRTR